MIKAKLTIPSNNKVPLWVMLPASNPRIAARDAAIKFSEPNHGFPDIIPIAEGVKRVILTEKWQLYIYQINPNMELSRVSGLLGDAVAFTNKTGLGSEETPRRDYLKRENLNSTHYPKFDKVRTCSYACHTGEIIENQLKLTTLDGNIDPPDIKDINPLSHPHLFFHATIVWMDTNGKELKRSPFVNKRAKAPQWGYNFEVTIMPLVSCVPVYIDLDLVKRVDQYILPYYNYP